MKLARFYYLALTIKYTSKTMVMMNYLSVFIVNYKATVILISNQKSFFVEHTVLIFTLARTALHKVY